MKKKNLILTTFLVTLMILTSCGGSNTPKNNRDIQKTNTESIPDEVAIGKQVWMVQNLNVDKFRNGDPIPEAKSPGEWMAYAQAGEAAWCYYDNNPAYGEKFGKLYNWYAVNDSRGLAPNGWHIPTDAEWTDLTDCLGGKDKAGAEMKSIEGWSGNRFGANNSDFSGLPGGFRDSDGRFKDLVLIGDWWSSTENNDTSAIYLGLNYTNGYDWVFKYDRNKEVGLSVRCVRD
jgi:uncharacterized protein (TIGR02145 family)